MAILSKEKLFGKVTEAINSCGWQVENQSDISQQPVRFEMTKGNETLPLRVYIWNLTNGGENGMQNELKIQAKTDRFEEETDSKTLILGYWDEKNVFAGFDISKHTGKPGWSASLHIKKEILEQAVVIKAALYSKENGEIAVAFRPDFFMNYILDFDYLHSTDNLDEYFIRNETGQPETIIDDTEGEALHFRYSLSSYGADFPVDSIVKRIKNDTIYVPPFQRKFVWNIKEASGFVESLILGLPVPGIFLSKEEETGRSLIIDGQQRLISLYSFYENNFKGKPFRLTGVQADLEDKTYSDLDVSDRLFLDDSIIHATIIKREQPEEDDESSIYFIFERLNSSGKALTPQEIRASIYYGAFNEYLNKIVLEKDWRGIFGKMNDRLKEQEMLLRFFALYFNGAQYQKPLKDFLNKFMQSNRKLDKHTSGQLDKIIYPLINYINNALDKNAFRMGKGVNAALFDSIMIGLSKRIEKGTMPNKGKFLEAYHALLQDAAFINFAKEGTSDALFVKRRIEIATSKFENLPQ